MDGKDRHSIFLNQKAIDKRERRQTWLSNFTAGELAKAGKNTIPSDMQPEYFWRRIY